MGTVLYGRGVFLNVCYDELSIRQPDLVRDIHREYVRAGAELLETNTFGANPLKLATYGLAGETERINAEAAAAGPRGGRRAAPRCSARSAPSASGWSRSASCRSRRRGRCTSGRRGACSRAASRDSSSRPSATWPSSAPPLQAVRGCSDLPIIAQMTVGTDGKTPLWDGPGGLRAGARGHGRRCHRRQLLGGPARRARGGGEAGAGGERADLRAAQRRAPARGGRPQDLHGLARVHGQLLPAHGRGRRPVRRRLLRHDARPHPRDRGLRPERVAPAHVRHGHVPGAGPRGGDRSGAARRPLAARAPSWRRGASSRRSRSCRPRASIRRRCSSRCASSRRPAWTRSTCPTAPARRAGWERCSRRS